MFELKNEALSLTETINGIAVLMDNDAIEMCRDKIIAVENNHLVIQNQ